MRPMRKDMDVRDLRSDRRLISSDHDAPANDDREHSTVIRTVTVPPVFYRRGIVKNHVGTEREWRLMGWDVETVNGKPYSQQFSVDGETGEFQRATSKTIFERFLIRVKAWAKPKACNIIVAHNLPFDAQGLLHHHQHYLTNGPKHFTIQTIYGTFEWYTDRVWWASLKMANGARVRIIDTMEFIEDSLEYSAHKAGIDIGKIEKPEYLGQRQPREHEKSSFQAYGIRDAVLAWKIGREVQRVHALFDVKLSVSAASMGWRVLRHCFLKKDDHIAAIPLRVQQPSECAQHGGKVRMYVPRGKYPRVWDLDINGAYAAALCQLPSPLNGRFISVQGFETREHGVLCVTGEVQDRYGVIFDHGFHTLHGAFENVWTTTYELEEAIRSGSVKLQSCHGFIWKSRCERNPFKEFAESCYRMRTESPEHSMERVFAKSFPNAVWGKMGQVHEGERTMSTVSGRIVTNKTFTASPSYHPFFSALVSGWVRAKVHQFEQKYEAIHTATDGFMTMKEPDPADIGTGMGQLKVQCVGPLTLFDKLLYIHTDERDGSVRFSRHKYYGSLDDLRKREAELLRGDKVSYPSRKMYSVREGNRMHRNPLELVNVKKELQLT